MKLKGSYFYTLREDAKDEDSKSGNLLVRSGMVKKVGAGIYMYLPLGLRTYTKLQGIVKEEMDKAGAQELLMPSLIPADYYAQSGRLESFGKDMFRLKDRKGTDLVLGPTHEELFAVAAKPMIRSYKDLPFTIYQQADKFRDEPRPRYGLIRVKEFIMKDAYSFDRDDEQLKESYDKMFNAYKSIFDRLGIKYKIVNAAVGAMGGDLSEEFQALADIGEDTVVLCDKCEYASNLEVATHEYEDDIEETRTKELIETPDFKTIEEVSSFLNIDVKKTVKALLMNVDGELVIFFVRGDRDLNETKAEILLDAKEINFADDELIATSNAVPGYTGPVGLEGCKIVIDEEVKHMKNFVVGANKEGYHYINVNFEDLNYDIVGDISNVVEGDICPHCGGHIKFSKGIEIGNTFKLGKHYCEDMGVTYLDENGKEQVPTMGCYGIGVGRTLAAVIEQNNDDHGMILPMNIAPYKVAIVVINTKDEKIMNYANSLHDELESLGIDTLLDDRDERPGVKFNDMDLIGIPVRVTIGKKFVDGQVEFRLRRESESTDVEISELVNKIKETVEKEMK